MIQVCGRSSLGVHPDSLTALSRAALPCTQPGLGGALTYLGRTKATREPEIPQALKEGIFPFIHASHSSLEKGSQGNPRGLLGTARGYWALLGFLGGILGSTSLGSNG